RTPPPPLHLTSTLPPPPPWAPALPVFSASTANLDPRTVPPRRTSDLGDSDRDSGDILTVANVQGSGDATAISVTAAGVVAHGTYGDLTILANGSYSTPATAPFRTLTPAQKQTDVFNFSPTHTHADTCPPTP